MRDGNAETEGRGAVRMVRIGAGVYVIAVVVNFPWEMLQAYLFEPMGTAGEATLRCLRASAGDGLMVVMVLLIGGAIFRKLDWFVDPRARAYGVMIATGAALAAIVERVAIATGRWAYRPEMPTLPGNLGVLPLLQMVLLPPLIFYLAARWVDSESEY